MFEFDVNARTGDLRVTAAGSVGPGECLAVTGPSGCGKTTLIRMLSGLHPNTGGAIQLSDNLWLDSKTGRSLPARARGIGLVAQIPALFPRMSAIRNVAFGAPSDYSSEERNALSRALLVDFGLAERLDAKPAALSGGEAARVALARALTSEPNVVLLDEPFAALDDATALETAQILKLELEDRGTPCVLVTHDQPTAELLCRRALSFDRDGSATEMPLAQAFSTPVN